MFLRWHCTRLSPPVSVCFPTSATEYYLRFVLQSFALSSTSRLLAVRIWIEQEMSQLRAYIKLLKNLEHHLRFGQNDS